MLPFRPAYQNNSYKIPLPETDTYVRWAWVDGADLDRFFKTESFKLQQNFLFFVVGLCRLGFF